MIIIRGENLMTYDELANQVMAEVEKSVFGKHDVVEKIFCAILAGGHVLIEDIPGLGKTTMALAFAKVLDLNISRMQFTPDVLPSDVLGFNMFDKDKGVYSFKPGAVFSNLFLADEINRTSPKSQSALLEVMEEGSVTVDGKTYVLEPPFIVLATQNPSGSAGTQMLPESQLDRFMIRVSMGYPSEKDEINILKSKKKAEHKEPQCIVSKQRLLEMQKIVADIFIHDNIYKYIVSLISATRANVNIDLGASPRAGVSMCRFASAYAFINGRDYVIPDDVVKAFVPVCEHRLILSPSARMNDLSKKEVLTGILETVARPKISTAR